MEPALDPAESLNRVARPLMDRARGGRTLGYQARLFKVPRFGLVYGEWLARDMERLTLMLCTYPMYLLTLRVSEAWETKVDWNGSP